MQVKKSTPFNPPFSYYQQYGGYPSKIQVNLHGSPAFALLRDAVEFLDFNSFVTLWISEILLETARFFEGPIPSDEQLLAAIQALTDYHDKNQRVRNPILVFWPQTYNATTGAWECGPINLNGIASDDEKITDFIAKILDDLGLGALWDKVAPIVNGL